MSVRSILLPGDFQDSGALSINPDAPAAGSIVCLLPLNGCPVDLKTGARLTIGSGASYAPDSKFYSLQGSGTAAVASLPLDLSAFRTVSVSFWLYWNSYANDDDLAFEFTTNASAGQGFFVDPNASSTAFDLAVSCGGGSGVAQGKITRPSAGAWHHIAFVANHGVSGTVADTVPSAWVDGAPVTITGGSFTGSAGANPFANSTLYLLSRANSSLFGAGRLQNLVIRGGYAITQADVAAEFRDPWSLYAPRRIWVPVSAGGSDIDIAGVVGNATAAGISGATAVSIDIAGAVANAVAAGVAGSAQVATEIAGSVGNAVAAGVAGSASVTNDINIDGVVGNAVAAGVAGDTSVGSDISISGTVGNAVAAGTAGVPGVSTTIAAAVGNATAAGVSGLAAIGVLIDGSVGNATAAGITGTLTLDIVVAGVVANAVAAGVTGSASVDAAAVSATPGYTIAAKARRLTITAAARRLEIRK